jgi:integrase
MPLNDTQCRNAKCPVDRPYLRMPDAGGLYLEISPSGGKLWRWKYRIAGKEKLLALGKYPAVSLLNARKARDAARDMVNAGTDPNQARKDAKYLIMSESELSFQNVARLWFEHWKADKVGRHAEYVFRRLEADAFPVLGAKPIDTITAPMLVRVIKQIDARGASDIARRIKQTTSQIFRWAVANGYCERNPAQDVLPSDILKPRAKENHAHIEAKDLPALLRAIDAYQGTPYTRFALILMAHTFVRTGELIGARWQEIDLEAAQWRIPKARMKVKRNDHIVPLATQVIDALRSLQYVYGNPSRCKGEAFLFPSETSPGKPMSNNTILKALERMGFKGKMTGHGFRHLASTQLHEMGYRSDVIEAQLAHKETNEVKAVYNKAQYLPERTRLMQGWADYMQATKTGAKVLALHSTPKAA